MVDLVNYRAISFWILMIQTHKCSGFAVLLSGGQMLLLGNFRNIARIGLFGLCLLLLVDTLFCKGTEDWFGLDWSVARALPGTLVWGSRLALFPLLESKTLLLIAYFLCWLSLCRCRCLLVFGGSWFGCTCFLRVFLGSLLLLLKLDLIVGLLSLCLHRILPIHLI